MRRRPVRRYGQGHLHIHGGHRSHGERQSHRLHKLVPHRPVRVFGLRSGRCPVIMKPSSDPLRVSICLGLLGTCSIERTSRPSISSGPSLTVLSVSKSSAPQRCTPSDKSSTAWQGRDSNYSRTGSAIRGVHDSDNSRNGAQIERLIRRAKIACLNRALNFADASGQVSLKGSRRGSKDRVRRFLARAITSLRQTTFVDPRL